MPEQGFSDDVIVVGDSIGSMALKYVFSKEDSVCKFQEVVPHCHTTLEFFFILEGTAKAYINHNIRELKRGDVCIIPEGHIHFIRVEDTSCRLCHFLLYIAMTDDAETLEESRYAYELINTIDEPLCFAYSSLCKQYVKQIDVAEASDLLGMLKMKKLCSVILLELLRHIEQTKKQIHPQMLHEYEDEEALLTRISKLESYMSKNYMKKITLHNLAKHLNLSERQTLRCISRFKRAGFSDLLTDMRMSKAREMIENGSLSLHEVATAVGYSSYQGFYNAFVKKYGASPGKFQCAGENKSQE